MRKASLLVESARCSFPRCASLRHFSAAKITHSGHSKWATIKHDKAKNDDKKNKLASKFAASIAVATRMGGPDPSHNVRLALAIENANKNNVAKKIIESAIKRGSGESTQSDSGPSEMALYEGIGPSGVAFIVEALTDNKARTAAQVKTAFSKSSGMLTPTLFMFERQGWAKIDPGEATFDDVFEVAAECGAEDVLAPDNEGIIKLVVSPQDTASIVEALKQHYKIIDMGIEYAPNEETMAVVQDDKAEQLEKLVSALDDIADVTQVYNNIKEIEEGEEED